MSVNIQAANGNGAMAAAIFKEYHPEVAALSAISQPSELGDEQMNEVRDLLNRAFHAQDQLQDSVANLAQQFQLTSRDLYSRLATIDERLLQITRERDEYRRERDRRDIVRSRQPSPAPPPPAPVKEEPKKEDVTRRFFDLAALLAKTPMFWVFLIAFLYILSLSPPIQQLVFAVFKKLGWL